MSVRLSAFCEAQHSRLDVGLRPGKARAQPNLPKRRPPHSPFTPRFPRFTPAAGTLVACRFRRRSRRLCFGPTLREQPAMFKGTFFVLRIAIAWTLLFIAMLILLLNLIDARGDAGPFVLAAFILGALVIAGAVSHVRRVRLIAGRVDEGTLRSRQRRQIEIPFEAGEAFDMLDAAVRELPRSQEIESARDSLQLRAKVGRPHVYGHSRLARLNPANWLGNLRNQVTATVTPGDGTGSVTLICE
ncbi:MAG: hypothetical protein ACTHJP_00520, partial [Rhodanobacteraceae bacterium]